MHAGPQHSHTASVIALLMLQRYYRQDTAAIATAIATAIAIADRGFRSGARGGSREGDASCVVMLIVRQFRGRISQKQCDHTHRSSGTCGTYSVELNISQSLTVYLRSTCVISHNQGTFVTVKARFLLFLQAKVLATKVPCKLHGFAAQPRIWLYASPNIF